MFTTLLDLLLFLISATSGTVEIEHVPSLPDFYDEHHAVARTDCGIETCTVRLSTQDLDREAGDAYLRGEYSAAGRKYAETLTHELIHVWDYMDNGHVDGSPGHQGYEFPDTELGRYFSANPVERYAGAVLETLSLTTVVEVACEPVYTAPSRPTFNLIPR